MSLLDQGRVDALMNVARERVTRRREALRGRMYVNGANSRPLGFDNLDTPDKVTTFTQFEQRQANREQMQRVPGDLNQTVVAHPAVQEMAASAAAPQEVIE